MSNQLQVFKFEDKTIRTHIELDESPWWAAADVCVALGLSNSSQAVARLDEDERRAIISNDTAGRPNSIIFINESGLYSLVLGSKKSEAKRFKKWVTSEVLPSIRKTGSFSFALNEKAKIYPAAEPVFKSLLSVAQVFGLENNQALLYANKATKRETGVDFQNVLQIELKNHDQERAFTPTELGQRLGLSAVKFNRELERLGFQTKKNDAWCATESGKKHSLLMDAGKKHSDGTPIQQLKWKESVLSYVSPKAA